MSNYAMTWVWQLRIDGLTPGAKGVLLRLADSANDDFECWPSQTTISADTGYSVRTVIAHLDLLEKLGLLSRRYILKANGARQGTLYKLRAGQKFVTLVVPTEDIGTDADDLDAEDALSAESALRDLPVDNFENLSADIAPRPEMASKNKSSLSADFADLSAKSALTLRKKPNLTPKLKDSSSSMSNSGSDGAPPSDDDDDDLMIVDRAVAESLREVHSRLDATLLVDRLQRSGQVEVAALDLVRAAVEILGGSARAVGDPVAYVAKAVLSEPWRWARESLPAMPKPTLGSRPPTVSECASRGHKWVGQWREMCAWCGVERDGWRDDRDGDGIEVAS